MRILILGGTGMLGHKLVQRLSLSFDVMTTVRGHRDKLPSLKLATSAQVISDIDLTRESDLTKVIERVEPHVVINAAGVIKQLPTSKDIVNTLMVNAILPHKLAALSSKHGFRLVVISTDCVFKGDRGAYREADPADALDLYGRSKNLGEVDCENCLTIRTSIIGREISSRHSLVEWFLNNRGGRVDGYTKAIYSGFPTIVFADIIRDLLLDHPDLSGLWHIASDPIDKFTLLKLIDRAYGAQIEIRPDASVVIDRSLDASRFRVATGFSSPSWAEMIDRMASDPTPYNELHNEHSER
jgi:dTDP-4-dehydrorhamnose reductase